ncbi:MAG: homoserine O-succinyltransferase [Alphaproteobacteria bacterium]|nr:homoserine O-succinyltransferase [Alphaproteobacteria bacterium]
MTVILPTGLPAAHVLRLQGVPVVEHQTEPTGRAVGERAMTIALVNLMPDKIATETQFARLLASGPQPVRMILTIPDGYRSFSASPGHMDRFYRPWSALPLERLDGVIITGAPVERLAFEDVRYWPALTDILDWLAVTRVPALHVCWAAQAALWHYHQVPKRPLKTKRFGVFPHVPWNLRAPLLTGVRLPMTMPVSRHTETLIEDLPGRLVRPLLVAPVASIGLAVDTQHRATYLLNHPEYDPDTLDREYQRDRARNLGTARPSGYYSGGDPSRPSRDSWSANARTLYRNWLTEVMAADPRCSAIDALDWLVFAETTQTNRAAGDRERPH